MKLWTAEIATDAGPTDRTSLYVARFRASSRSRCTLDADVTLAVGADKTDEAHRRSFDAIIALVADIDEAKGVCWRPLAVAHTLEADVAEIDKARR